MGKVCENKGAEEASSHFESNLLGMSVRACLSRERGRETRLGVGMATAQMQTGRGDNFVGAVPEVR